MGAGAAAKRVGKTGRRGGGLVDVGDRFYFFEACPCLLAIAGFDGYFKDVNPAWTRVTGWSRKELLARPWRSFIHPEDRARSQRAAAQLRRGGPLPFFETQLLCKDGSQRALLWEAVADAPRSRIYAVLHTVELGRLGGRLEAVEQATHTGVWELDVQQRRVWWSPELYRIHGLGPSFMATPESLPDLIHADDRARVLECVARVLTDGEPASFEYRIRRSDGRVRLLRSRLHPVRDAAGHTTGIIATAQDITPDAKPGPAPPGAGLDIS